MKSARDASSRGRSRGAPFYVTAHVALYQATGGAIGGRGGSRRFLLLTTTGRRTGQRHTVPLPYFFDGETPYVVASNYGKDRSPVWYLNLAAHPAVEVQVGRERSAARARVAAGDERARIWKQLIARHENYARYQRRTQREIPIVLLEHVA